MSAKDSKESTKKQVPVEDVVVLGKYNAALFLPSRLGEDGNVTNIIHRGLELNDIRKFIQRDLIRGDDRCSELFADRNHKASDCKIEKFSICSYCGNTTEADKLLLYFTIVHAEDVICKEFDKLREKQAAAFKHVQMFQLETKMRDVRQQEPITINAGCGLVCPARCDKCMKIQVIDTK